MRLLFVLVLISFLTLSGCTGNQKPEQQQAQNKPPAAQQQEVLTVSSYFPLKKDAIYKYEGQGNEYASKVVTLEYLKGSIAQINTNTGGTALAEVVIVGQGAVKKVFKKEESYWREDFTAQRGESEEIILQQPLTVGNEWESNGKKYRIAAVDANVTVPYGTFKTLKVVTELEDSTFTRYFAKGIGIVKEEFVSGNTVVSSSLSEVVSEPVKMNIDLFYPNKNLDGLYSVKKELAFNTNEGLAEKILALLQQPEEGEAFPAIDKNVQLLSYERKDTSILLNFSKELVMNTNIGAGEEQLRLDAIVQTFGKAYNVEGVIINVENQGYETGHFSYGKDEVLKVK